MELGKGGGTFLKKSFPRPLQTSPTPSKDFRLVGRPRNRSSFRRKVEKRETHSKRKDLFVLIAGYFIIRKAV